MRNCFQVLARALIVILLTSNRQDGSWHAVVVAGIGIWHGTCVYIMAGVEARVRLI